MASVVTKNFPSQKSKGINVFVGDWKQTTLKYEIKIKP